MSQASLSYQGLRKGWLRLHHQPREEAKAIEFIGLLYIKVYYICKIYCTEPIGLSSVLPKAKTLALWEGFLTPAWDRATGAEGELGSRWRSQCQPYSRCALSTSRRKVTRDGTKGGRVLDTLGTLPHFSLLSPPSLDCALGVKYSHRLVQCCSGPGHGHGPEFMHTGMTGQEVATPWHPGLASLLMDHQTDSSYIPCCTHERQT